MDPVTIIAIVGGALGSLAAGIPLGKRIWDKFKTNTADNAKITSFEGMKDYIKDALTIWEEEKEEIRAFVQQAMVLSKAVDNNSEALERINTNDALRKALIETAQKMGPDAVDALAAALTPVPSRIRELGGMELDKLKKLTEAQRQELSSKEATNKVLENSGKMARNIATVVAKVAPVILQK